VWSRFVSANPHDGSPEVLVAELAAILKVAQIPMIEKKRSIFEERSSFMIDP
jgi:hypothetical protein